MIEPHSYLLFVGASLALILVPGPAQALVIATTLDRGQGHGALTAAGLNVGTLFHAAAAGLGLSAILATSAFAFSIVKYVGAAYLLYLGIKALRSKPKGEAVTLGRGSRTGARAAFGQAVLTGILNPKVALFFLAFLPQFVDPSRGAVVFQFLLLGLTMAVLDTCYELALVHVTHRLRGRLSRSRRLETLRNRISGVVLVLLGLRLALQQR
jgi:threonine/homoserine/homoserine lactone efflux protein